jgi:predicted phosphodiesterase
VTVVLLATFLLSSLAFSKETIFYVTGDTPYSQTDMDLLKTHLAEISKNKDAKFIIHLGDIKDSVSPCLEKNYKDVSALLLTSKKPVLIIPGDNEYNDCENPALAWDHWSHYCLPINKRFQSTLKLSFQEKRPENFSFIYQRVLFIGINLVGGRIHNGAEWETRLNENEAWLNETVSKSGSKVDSLVLFAHAITTSTLDQGVFISSHAAFTNAFCKVAREFKKPVLYIHGDGHIWIQDQPWPEKNIWRVQVMQGGNEDPLMIKIVRNQSNPFLYYRHSLQER